MLDGNQPVVELPEQRLERMRNEFRDAQQRRRATPADAVAPPGHTDDGPHVADPADATPPGIAAERRS